MAEPETAEWVLLDGDRRVLLRLIPNDPNKSFGGNIDIPAGATPEQTRELVVECLRAAISFVERGHADDALGIADGS